MTEAYLTMNDMSEITTLMSNMNRFKNGRYNLEIVLTDKLSKAPIGTVKQIAKGGDFCFVPNSTYTPYAPTDRGE